MIKIRITMAWWWDWLYVPAIAGFAAITNMEPDWDKVKAMAGKAIRIKVVE